METKRTVCCIPRYPSSRDGWLDRCNLLVRRVVRAAQAFAVCRQLPGSSLCVPADLETDEWRRIRMGQQGESIARFVATRKGHVDSGFDHDGIVAVRAATRGFFRGDGLLRPRPRILRKKSSTTAEGCREVRRRFLWIPTHHPLAGRGKEESCCSGSLQNFAQRLQHEQAVDDTFRWVLLVFPAPGQGAGKKRA